MFKIIRLLVTFAIFHRSHRCVRSESRGLGGAGGAGGAAEFARLAARAGLAAAAHDVRTADGYVLGLFRVRGRGAPVLLVHGAADAADTFLLRGRRSLGAALARAGRDVWFANARGNRHSRRHVALDPDRDRAFWDFGLHEHGRYDLPAIVDFVLRATDAPTLSAVGHSLGNTMFLVMGATRPEYNDKIDLLVALAPICFLSHLRGVPAAAARWTLALDRVLSSLGIEEVLGDGMALARLFRAVCGLRANFALCLRGIFFPVAGSDPAEIEPAFVPALIARYPTGTSRKNLVHLAQISISRKFARFDYGRGNRAAYNATEPPEYELGRVSMHVALVAGRNDRLATAADVAALRARLPAVAAHVVVARRRHNHMDAVWGRNMDSYLFPHIFELLDGYCCGSANNVSSRWDSVREISYGRS